MDKKYNNLFDLDVCEPEWLHVMVGDTCQCGKYRATSDGEIVQDLSPTIKQQEGWGDI